MQSQMIQQSVRKDIMDLPIILSVKLKVDSKSKVELAYANTLVVSSKFRRFHSVSHFDSTGQLIKSLQIENFINFTMLNEETVIVLSEHPQEAEIRFKVWRLVSGRTQCLSISQAKITTNSHYSMFVFKKTKIFCFCHYTSKLLQLFYYRLPLAQDDDPFHIYTLPIHQENSRLLKVNEHSMIGLLPASPHYRIEFLTYSLKCQGIGGLLEHHFELKKALNNEDLNGESVCLQIKDVWEIKPTIFYIQCVDSNSHHQFQQGQERASQHYFTFYCNYLRKTIIKSKLTSVFPEPHRIQFINCLRMMNTVEEFNIEYKRIPKNVPIYYVNPLNEEVVSKYMGEYHRFGLGNFCWPNYETGSLLEYEYEFYAGSMNVKVRLYCPTWQGIKCISTFLLNEIIDYCEDDLIDAVCGLVSEEDQYENPYGYLQKLSKQGSTL